MRVFFKQRNLFIVFGLFIGGALFYMTYLLNSIGHEEANLFIDQDQVEILRKKIQSLEHKAVENEKILEQLEISYKTLFDNKEKAHHQHQEQNFHKENFEPNKEEPKNQVVFDKVENNFSNIVLKSYLKQCEWFGEQKPKSSDFEISELIEKLPFDDIDGGVWKQGFDITYNPNQWTEEKKLNVIIIPHSHNDPGWIMTFEEYFAQRTKNILDTIVNSLSEKETRKFVWAETSYLSLWWKQANDEMKNKFKHLVLNSKQLEIVTGGWVMTDEANSHYYAMIEQMIEGHEWLKANIDQSIRPNYGWSVDPFGYTPTMPYLLKQMGFDGMLIQRVHYHLKKYMAQNQRFEFMWRQSWSSINSKDTSIYCHVMPFYSYDIPHTCGPDPKICCQFDFKRVDGHISCPWGIAPQLINARNVDERSRLLLDQYRKKSQLYGDKENHNVLLVSLGDDFRYQDMQEAHLQFENYEKLMDYMNNKPEFNVNIKFGTLKDYFELLNKNNKEMNKKLETFSGDFFTYADRNDHYWSGYFTSRAFYKRLDRLVEYYLRSTEIIYSFANLLESQLKSKFTQANYLYQELLIARRNLALFQHHDGIVGTSKRYVVLDYANKLYKALNNCKNILEQGVSYLMSEENSNEHLFSIDDVRLSKTENKEAFIRLINDDQKVVLINTNLNKREEIVSFRVNTPNVEVVKADGTVLQNAQINLVWPNTDGGYLTERLTDRLMNQDDISYCSDFDKTYYELLFQVSLEPLSMNTFTLRKKKNTESSLTKVTFYSAAKNLKLNSTFSKQIELKEIQSSEQNDQMIKIKISQDYEAYFSPKTGFLNKLVSPSKTIKTKLKLIKYGTTTAREKSGAYLFLPDGPAQSIEANLLQWIRVEHGGLLRNRVCVNMTLVLHCIEFYPLMNDLNKFKIPHFSAWNVVDLRQSHNYELAMLIETDIQNDKILHSDLNGFQYTKRKRYDKLTIQGNVYPMPTGAFIQDSKLRFNLLTGQPLGVGSLEDGAIQVFLDRRLDQDDNRGMEEAMNDNVVVSNRFLLFFEEISGDLNQATANYPSLMSNMMSFDLLNPILKLVHKNPAVGILKEKKFLNKNFPCDLRLVNMRTMQTKSEEPIKDHVGLLLHRISYDDCKSANFIQLPAYYRENCEETDRLYQVKFADLFNFIEKQNLEIKQTYLTLAYKKDDSGLVKKNDYILDLIQPMQIEAFRVSFS